MKTIEVKNLGDIKNVVGNVMLSTLVIIMDLNIGKEVITENLKGEKVKLAMKR